MDVVFGVLLLVLASSPFVAWGIDDAIFNVTKYGAISDGRTDNSQAFLKAWDEACKAAGKSATLYVPPGTTFLVNPVTFHGPCAASFINFLNLGKIVAPASPQAWDGKDAGQWLVFMNINGLTVGGNGIFDGQGKLWWNQSCRFHQPPCTKKAPTALTLTGCNESEIKDVKFVNSGQTHILLYGSNKLNIHNVTIESPQHSPNTDGIHIQSCQHLHITNSTIANGDDCISIGDHTSDLNINNIHCTFGHGISIGSLGNSGNFVQVENINVTDCIFNQTTNGARIKTWQVERGYLKQVAFERLTFNNVENPIIIDQNYCNVTGRCSELKTGVAISNVTYRNAVGTSATEIAINLNCSRAVPCRGILMESIELTSAKLGKQVTANCSNAFGEEVKVVPAGPCLQHDTKTRSSNVAWNSIQQYIYGDDVPTLGNVLQRAFGDM